MEDIHNSSIRLELKYCERCGGLWLRLKDSELVYCPPCTVVLAGIARNSAISQQGAVSELEFFPRVKAAFWGEGGNA